MPKAIGPIVILLLFVFLPQAGKAQQNAKGRSEGLTLRFQWKIGSEATVVYQRSVVKDSTDHTDTTRLQMAFRMSIEPHPKGMLIRRQDPLGLRLNGRSLPAAESLGVMKALGGLMASIIVSNDGEFLDIYEKDSLVARALQKERTSGRLNDPKVEAVAKEQMERALTQAAAEEWTSMVEGWIGVHLKEGVQDTVKWDSPYPLTPEVRFPLTTIRSLRTGVDCSESSPAETGVHDVSCIGLSAATYVDPDSLATKLAEVFDRLGQKMGSAFTQDKKDAVRNQIAGLTARSNTFLVTSPNTLRPTLVVLQRIFQMKVAEKQLRHEDTRTYAFQYKADLGVKQQ